MKQSRSSDHTKRTSRFLKSRRQFFRPPHVGRGFLLRALPSYRKDALWTVSNFIKFDTSSLAQHYQKTEMKANILWKLQPNYCNNFGNRRFAICTKIPHRSWITDWTKSDLRHDSVLPQARQTDIAARRNISYGLMSELNRNCCLWLNFGCGWLIEL